MDVVGEGADGQRERRTWLLTAKENHGPEIPTMAAVLLALKLSRGESVPTGARPCVGLFSLSEFASEFARWGITTQLEVSAA